MRNTSTLFSLLHLFLMFLTITVPSVNADETLSKAPCCQSTNEKSIDWIELPESAIEKLQIDAGFGWGIFSGSIYNGNEHYHLTRLVVSMTPIHGHGHGDHHMGIHASMSHDPREYSITLDVSPKTKGAISMPLPNEDAHIHDFDWKIIKVMGYSTH